MTTYNSTIGTQGGRDYGTINAFAGDQQNLADSDPGADSIGVVYNDSVFDEFVEFDTGNGSDSLNSLTLTVFENDRHTGIAGTGARIERTGPEGVSCLIIGFDFQVEWLEVDMGGNSGDGIVHNAFSDRGHIQNCIVHDIAGNDLNRGIAENSGPSIISNNIVYDISSISAASAAIGIRDSNSATVSSHYNNTVFNITNDGTSGPSTGMHIQDAVNQSYRNNIVIKVDGSTAGSKQCFSDATVTSGLTSNNIASDTTASGFGSLDSETAATVKFVSTLDGSEDLRISDGAGVGIAGAADLGTSDNIDIDISGLSRNGLTWDIGAHQFTIIIIPPPGDRPNQHRIGCFEQALVTGTQAIDIGFTPKAMIFFSTDTLKDDLSFGLPNIATSAHGALAIGFASESGGIVQQAATCQYTQHSTQSTETGALRSHTPSGCFLMVANEGGPLTGTPTYIGEAEMVSMGQPL